jgi:hypothetical protein
VTVALEEIRPMPKPVNYLLVALLILAAIWLVLDRIGQSLEEGG